MKANKLAPIHPGEILREEFMKPRGLSQNALARALHVPPRRINEIVLEKRGITADTALRLARYFGTSAEMWTGLQADYDLRVPYGNHLEALTDDRKGQHSIRVNDQWRICFCWQGEDALDVEIVDYH